MSPKMKKILMLLGAAVGGYVVYTKVIKKSAAAPKLAAAAQLAQIKSNAVMAVKMSGTDHLLEELGVSESLGTLGSKRR